MFAVVEFEEQDGGGLCIVSNKWLTPRKKEVFWPPYKDQNKYTRAVKKAEDINTETWSLYPIARIFFEGDEYETVYSKLKRAEVTSDLQTETEDSICNAKRKCVAPRRLLSVSSSEEESESVLPRPAPINKSLLPEASKNKSRSNCLKDRAQYTSQTEIEPFRSKYYPNTKTRRSKEIPCEKEKGASQEETEHISNRQDSSVLLQGASTHTPRGNHFNFEGLVHGHASQPCSGFNSSMYDTPTNSTGTFLSLNKTAYQTLLSELVHIKEQNKNILTLLETANHTKTVQPLVLLDQLPVKLSLESVADLDTLEEFFKNPENVSVLVCKR